MKMPYKKLPASLLFLFSFAIIVIGGYRCSTNVTHDSPTGAHDLPIVENGEGPRLDDSPRYPDNYGPGRDPGDKGNVNLPPDPGNRCARSQYRQLAERYGESGVFKFDQSSLEDYRLGTRSNFDVRCPRIYLDMNKLGSSSKIYKGTLSISYEDGQNIKLQRFRSGWTAEENQYNQWSGSSWTANRNGEVNKQFHAIFEDEFGALIVKLEDVRLRDIRDGEEAYFGSGEIYYKMFRIWTGDKNNVCYSKGTYVSQARSQPPRKKICWLLGTGPFSCRPNGALGPRVSVTKISLTGGLRCYSRLGVFFGLNIKEAFNVGNVELL